MSPRLARYAWAVLAWNVAVILWGAYVRASGSGAGCGAHWPLCNGVVVPRGASITTLVEFSHRLTSGLALISVVILLVWTWRSVRAPHPARTAAACSVVFILTEAAVGAGLVLFRLVADNASMARAMFMAAHLTNTFILLASLTLTAHWLSGGAPIVPRARRLGDALIALGFAGLLLTGVSGAVAALGDTLFPSGSLGQALSADLSATSHLLIRLRVLHPALAISTALALIAAASRSSGRTDPACREARLVMSLAAVQIAAGFLNVLLLAPVWMQLVHLLIADAVWISYVLFAAALLGSPSAATRSAQAA